VGARFKKVIGGAGGRVVDRRGERGTYSQLAPGAFGGHFGGKGLEKGRPVEGAMKGGKRPLIGPYWVIIACGARARPRTVAQEHRVKTGQPGGGLSAKHKGLPQPSVPNSWDHCGNVGRSLPTRGLLKAGSTGP